MRRSIRTKLAAIVVAVGALGMFTSSAFAGGYSSINSAHSFSSPPGGTCNAAFNTPAGSTAHGAPVGLWPFVFDCGIEG
jgi:hypothetical protein